jgi:hypothetical protein
MALSTNKNQLVSVAVLGEIAPQRYVPASIFAPVYYISNTGQPRVLPSTGGITYNVRVGDRIKGIVGDHVEPAVTAKNPDPEANAGFNILSCVGNEATVVSGDAKGAKGVVTGTHGGAEHVMIDFDSKTLDKLVIGDKIQVRSLGVGLAIDQFPDILCTGLDPNLFEKWVTDVKDGKLVVPVAKTAPAAIMGSGLGRDNVFRGDYDITMFDPKIVQQHGLDELRFGDFVAIIDADSTYGRHFYTGAISIGIVVHGDSIISGHGPGVTGLLTSRSGAILPVIDRHANIADLLKLR